jgi:hypothetical protein
MGDRSSLSCPGHLCESVPGDRSTGLGTQDDSRAGGPANRARRPCLHGRVYGLVVSHMFRSSIAASPS